MTGKLPRPKLPPLTLRALPPPDAAAPTLSGEFEVERRTPTKGATLTMYNALVSVFDQLTPEERIDFIELAFSFKDMPEATRKELIARARGY